MSDGRDGREVPKGRVRRLASLARVGAKAGASMLAGGGADAAAQHAAEVLGSLRGLAAKVGQMASYVDGLVPEGYQDVFEQAMSGLRDQAPVSPPDAIEALIAHDLGAPVHTLFSEWERRPFASASIGQVHRARLDDGREVAVKVQHPGIDAAIEADLRNGQVLQRMAAAFVPRDFNAKEIYAEIADRFRDELDYRLEAERQRQFRQMHDYFPRVHIPRVIPDRSGRHVLCTEMVHGMPLKDAITQPEDIRRSHVETLWHFAFKTTLIDGLFNADPHPGNYIFHDDGSVTFLDFGCVQPLTARTIRHSRKAHIAAIQRDESAFYKAAAELGQTRGGHYERAFTSYLKRCLLPIFESPFRVTRPFVGELVTGMYSLKQDAFTRGSQVAPLPPGTALLNRLQFGFLSVVARFDVEADFAAVERAFFERSRLM